MKGIVIYGVDPPETCDDCLSGFRKTIGCEKAMFFDGRCETRHPECPIHRYSDDITNEAIEELGKDIREKYDL